VAFSFGGLGFEAPTRTAAELLLGERARALEARARAEGLLPCAWERGVVRLRLRSEALTAGEIAALARAPALRLARPSSGTDGLATLDGSREALERLAREEPVFSRLLAAHEAFATPPSSPLFMGVLNVTPDSFSDGGHFLEPKAALERGLALVRAGARILDVGGESTRPGAAAVPTEIELERVLPVIGPLAAATDAPISIDTSKAEVAAASIARGARLVNDVSAGRNDPELLGVVARTGTGIVLMHMRGTPPEMQRSPAYVDVVREVVVFLRERAARCLEAGIDPGRIAIDPGIGFGKRLEDNLALLRALPELRSLGLPIVLGASRKSFLGALSGTERPADRHAETLGATAIGAALGADIHRVHDPESVIRVLAVARGLRGLPG